MPVGAASSPTRCVNFRLTEDPSDGVQSNPSVPGTMRFGIPPAPWVAALPAPVTVPSVLVGLLSPPPTPVFAAVVVLLGDAAVVTAVVPAAAPVAVLAFAPATAGSGGSAFLQAAKSASGTKCSAQFEDKCMGERFT